MSDLTTVPGPSSPLRGSSGKVVAVVVIGVLLAVIKPWGSESVAQAPPPAVSSAPSGSSEPSTAPTHNAFDFGVFEGFEPQPAWEIWPAGREISFGFAMRIDPDPDASTRATPVPLGSGPPPGSAGPAASATPARSPSVPADPADPPTWSDSISISPVSTLTVIAINMPRGVTIPTTRLSRLVPGADRVEVPMVRLPSPWPDHFLVLGIDDGSGSEGLPAWPTGRYALDLDIEPGGYTRTIGIIVGEPVVPVPTPTTLPSPAASTEPSPS